MPEPEWILPALAHAIHLRQLAEHGGQRGIRDKGLLAAALARPRQQYAYAEPTPDIIALAAIYVAAVVQNHPFNDGNKRTGLALGLTFLELNGYTLEATQTEIASTVLDLASGNLELETFTKWLQSRTQPHKAD